MRLRLLVLAVAALSRYPGGGAPALPQGDGGGEPAAHGPMRASVSDVPAMGTASELGSNPRQDLDSCERSSQHLRNGMKVIYKITRHRWRSAQAVRAAKREMRVGASGRWANQAVRRSRLRAAAVATFCRPVLASPR